MGLLTENITVKLLGLEVDLWMTTKDAEQSSYKMVTICYISYLFLTVFSSIFLIFLITTNYWISVPGGMLVALIIGSVVRFSLIILRRSVFKDPLPNSTIIVSTPAKPFIKRIIEKIKGFKITLPGAQSPVPGMAFLLRLIIISVMGLLVLFPLASFFHFNVLQEVNQVKRDQYLEDFRTTSENSFQRRVAKLKNEIKGIRNDLYANKDIYQQGGVLTQKQLELSMLQRTLEDEQQSFKQDFNKQYNTYKDILQDRYFLSLTFMSVIGKPFFNICFILIGFLLLVPHLQLYRLKSIKGETYARLSTDHYRKIILNEYQEFKKEEKLILKQKYAFEVTNKDQLLWQDPPFCTLPNQVHVTRKVMTKEEFLHQLEAEQSLENKSNIL